MRARRLHQRMRSAPGGQRRCTCAGRPARIACADEGGARASVRLLHAAHVVDGIVKGLPADGWPRDSWQALRKLAMDMVMALHGPTGTSRR